MLTITVIRSGSTEFDQDGRIQGTLDVPLSDQGRDEIARAIETLRPQKLEALYSAPCDSAVESSRALGEALHIKHKPIDKLRNIDHGLWQGMLIEDVRTKQPKVYRQWQEHPENVCPPGGEMLSDARARLREAIVKLAKKHKTGAIGLVVPEPLASFLCRVLREEQVRDLWHGAPGGTWESIPFSAGVTIANS